MPTYQASAAESRFSVQAFAGGLLSAFAHNPTFVVRRFTATLEFDPDSPAAGTTASIELAAEAESLQQTDSVKASDREEIERTMRGQVLETAKFPQIAYRSTAIAADKVTDGWFRLRIDGNLSLHGVTKDHAMEATVRTSESQLRFTGDTTIRLSDFRVRKVTALAGAITLKEEVKLSFDLAMTADAIRAGAGTSS